MLQAYSTNLSVTANSNITFNNKTVPQGIYVSLGDDSQTITIRKEGIYRVDFNATGSSIAAGTIGAQLYKGNAPVVNAQSIATTGAGEPQAISFSTLITVASSPTGNLAKISVQYTGTSGTLNMANIIVTKVR